MAHGQTIQLFLVDGTPSGIWIAQIMGRTIRAIVVSRNQLEALAERSEIRKTGLYILAGTDPNTPLQHTIYIGQSENVWNRLKQHDADENKDFWTRTIVFSSADSNLTKSHVLYLESRLVQIANENGRANMQNGNAPSLPSLPEHEVAYMEEWLDWIRLILPVIGYNFAVPVPKATPSESVKEIETSQIESSLRLYSNKSGVDAHLHEVDNEWIIIKGSTFRREIQASLSETLTSLRQRMLDNQILVELPDNPEYLMLTQNYPTSSLSMAASIVNGTSYNGKYFWYVEGTNLLYGEWRRARLNEIEQSLPPDDE